MPALLGLTSGSIDGIKMRLLSSGRAISNQSRRARNCSKYCQGNRSSLKISGMSLL